MNSTLRSEYLAAMNLESWVLRAPPAAAADADWPQLRARVAGCTRCALSATRTQTVFGVGNTQADWLIVGEAPGAEEDRQGEPFVGRAGQLLNSMLHAIGLAREQVFKRTDQRHKLRSTIRAGLIEDTHKPFKPDGLV